MAQAFRTQNLRLLGNLFDKNNSLGAKGYSLYSTGDGTAWKADQNEASGILTGGILSIGTGNTISVSAGTGQIYTNTVVSSEIVTTVTSVSWNAFTNVSLTYLATKQFTYLYIDQFGALIQSDTVFSDAVFKSSIIIGIVVHLNSSTVNAVINSQNVAYGDAHRLYELYNSFGPMKRSGLSLSANGANLKINRSSGTALLIGCNYTTDQFEPDIATITSYTDVKFARVRANGTGGFTFDSNSGSLYAAIDPNNYDNGTGTLASVTSGYWTIQRFYLFPNITDRLVNYYGVATYATLTDALIALPNENFNESPFTARDTVFLGYVIVKQGVTDLSSSSNAKFIQGGLSRSLSSSSASGGGSTVAVLDDLSDVQITTALGGQFLTYDSATSLWKNRSFILDANNNELIKFPSSVASAVNELTISNAATTGSPSISATGDDANIGLNLIPKGTGLVQINGKAISLANSFTTSGNFALTFTTTATTSLTLPTSGTLATTSQIPTVYDNTLTLAGSGGISLSATPTFTANASADKTITISIADGALAISKLADITTLRILGRTSASTGPVEQLDGTGVVAVIGSSAVSRAVNIGGGIAGQIPYQSGANATAFSAAGTANQVLLSGGTGAPTWANQSSLSVGSATTAGSLANALTISSPLTGTSYNGSAAVSIGLQNATASLSGGVSTSAQTFGGDKTFADNVIVSGNLTVNGTTVTVNTTTLAVKDKNIELGLVTTPTDVTADGGGITLKGTIDKTFNWINATSSWTSSENLDLVTGKTYRINNVAVLSATTLGSSVVNSSLTSVGTLTNLTVTNTITGSVSGSAGSLSTSHTFWGQTFDGTQNVSGNLTSVGNITGSSGLTITAGGSNQNVVLTPSGTGYTLLNGSVGIGNSTPNNKLTIQAGDNKDSGPIINLGGNAINQFESGRIRFTEVVTGATPFYQGAYLHYDASNNLFHIGVHDASDSLIASDTNAISIIRSNGNVGIGTVSPGAKLEIKPDQLTSTTLYRALIINTDFASASGAGFGGSIVFKGRTAGNLLQENAQISAYNEDIGDNGYALGFYTRPTVTDGLLQRLTILRGGNVGIGINTPSARLHINSATSGATLLRADGTNGTLFSVTDDLSDSLMSVNNSAGLPVLEVFADDRVVMGQYGQNDLVVRNNKVGAGTVNPINKLSIIGAASIGDSTYNVSAPTNGLIVQGDVGIGITTPTSQSNYRFLQVNGANSAVIEAVVGGVRIGGFDSTSSILYVGTIGAFPIVFRTGVDEKWRITNAGVLQSSAAQTIQTATGNLTLATAAGNGHIVLSPHGTGNVGIGTNSPASKLHVVSSVNTIVKTKGGTSNNQGSSYYVEKAGDTSTLTAFGDAASIIGGTPDANACIWTAGSVSLIYHIGGSEKIRFTSDGNVGIGTTSPSKTLDVRGAGGVLNLQSTSNDVWQTLTPQTGNTWRVQAQTGNTFGIYDEAASAFRLLINSSGNVGIGITSPNNKLHVYNSAGSSTTASNAIAVFEQNSNAVIQVCVPDANASGLFFSRSGSAYYSGIERSGTDLFLKNNSTTAVTINSSGSVGIGTTSPGSKLYVSAGTLPLNQRAVFISADITTNTSVYTHTLNLIDSATDANPTSLALGTYSHVVFRNRAVSAGSVGGILDIYTRGASTDPTVKMTITDVGNVGIGTTSPSAVLHVYGTAFKFEDTSTDSSIRIGPMANQYPYRRFDSYISDNTGYFWGFGQKTAAGATRVNAFFLDNNRGLFSADALRVVTFTANEYNGSIPTYSTPVLLAASGVSYINGGNVGIGTNSPNSKTHIVSDSKVIQLQPATSTNQFYIAFSNDNWVSNRSLIGLDNSAGNNLWATGGSAYALSIGTVDSRNIIFATNNNERVRIDTSGNVGIGTTNPTEALYVLKASGDSSATFKAGSGGAEINLDATNGYAAVKLYSSGTEKWRIGQINDSNGFQIWQSGTGARIYVNSSGNVGIGITTPTNTIDINGTARVRTISASASAATIFLTTDANGVLISRTAAQVRSDIGAGTGNGTVTSVTGSGGLASSGGTTPDISIATDGVTTAKILNSNVTYAKIQNVAVNTVLGNSSASVAQAPVEINMTTLATMLSGKTMDIVGNATNVTGVVAIANGGTGAATTTANAFFVGPNGSSGAPSFRIMATADIPAGIITFAKLQDVAGPTLIGRISATAGPVAALSSANARSAIGATTVGSNLITLPDVTASDKFLRVNFADNTVSALDAATFRNAIGAGIGSGTVTSVTGTAPIASSGGTTPAISLNDAGVTYAKIQNVSATSRVLGRISASAGVIEELTGANVATIIGSNAIENATNVTIATDDATNSSYYLYFGANATGNTPLKASTKIRYNPNTGAFSATTKSFRIPHPTKPEHDLVYGSLESPYHGIRLTGKGKTNGVRAEIILPNYVKLLIDENTVNVQITAYKCSKVFYVEDIIIQDNKIVIKYDKSWYEKAKDIEFFWDFTAERKDVPKLIVEEKL